MTPLAAALLTASLTAAPATPARRVAVLDFGARWASSCADKGLTDAQQERCEVLRLFADKARVGALTVLRPPAFIVMTRENTAQILKDMGGACSEGECEVETARLLGASIVVSGEVTFMEGTWVVSLKVHDVASAALLGGSDTRAKTKLDAFDNVRAETEKMLRAAALDGVAPLPAQAAVAAKPVEPVKPSEVAKPPAPVVPVERPAPAVEPARAPPSPPPLAPARAEPVVEAPKIAAEPAPEASAPLAGPGPGSAGRWGWEFRAGFAKIFGGSTEPSSLEVKQLGDFALSAGYRVRSDWAFYGDATLNSPSTFVSGGNTELSAWAWRLCAGAAWYPQGNRWFSIAPELGFAAMTVEARIVSAETKSQTRTSPSLGLSLRFDLPLGADWFVGVRAGVVATLFGFDLTNSDGTDTIRFQNDVAIFPVNLAVGRRL